MKKIKGNYLVKFNEYALIFMLLAIIIIIGIQVIARTFFGNAFSWVEEVIRYIFVFVILGGSALAYEKNLWVSVDVVGKKFPKTVQKVITVIIDIIAILFFAILSYQGFLLFKHSAGQLTPALQFPIRYVYLAMPIFFFQLLYFALKRIYRDIKA